MNKKANKSIQWSPLVIPEKARHGAGFTAFRINDSLFDGLLNPILNIDHFFMSQPTFPPHPHAGFSAITYMFEDSENAFLNRDSLGDESVIHPGDLHWAQAGRGILHEEMPLKNGLASHGLQIFMNLPKSLKNTAPKIYRIANEQAPRVLTDHETAKVKVVTGKFGTTLSPVQADWPTDLLQLTWLKDGPVRMSLSHNQSVLILNMKDTVVSIPDHEGLKIPKYAALAAINRELDTLEFKIEATQGSDVVVIRSQTIDEPVLFHGPFVATTPEEINQIIDRYRRGDFGQLLPRGEE